MWQFYVCWIMSFLGLAFVVKAIYDRDFETRVLGSDYTFGFFIWSVILFSVVWYCSLSLYLEHPGGMILSLVTIQALGIVKTVVASLITQKNEAVNLHTLIQGAVASLYYIIVLTVYGSVHIFQWGAQ